MSKKGGRVHQIIEHLFEVLFHAGNIISNTYGDIGDLDRVLVFKHYPQPVPYR